MPTRRDRGLRRHHRRHARGGNRQARRHAGRSTGRGVLRDRFRELVPIGEPVGRGYYVIFVAPGRRAAAQRARTRRSAAIARRWPVGSRSTKSTACGTTQQQRARLAGRYERRTAWASMPRELSGWAVIRSRGWLLVQAAGMTILLACVSMPMAMLLGLAVAVARMYGPAPLRWLAVGVHRGPARHAAVVAALRDVLPAAGGRASPFRPSTRRWPGWRSTTRPTKRKSIAPVCRPCPAGRWKRRWRWACRRRWPCGE